ncbi:hypothetical protein ACOMHN_039927 [Nucella lapillus]
MEPGKTVEVFTKQGLTGKKSAELGESELRYEVFYPSPASSSISHNPKYIKQDMDEAYEDSEQHVQHGKAKKQHQRKQRKRMTLKDVDDWELHSCHSHPYRTLTDRSHTVSQEEFSKFRHAVREERTPSEYLFSSLIEKAQQLQSFRGVAKTRRKKSKTSVFQEEDKSHIVYVTESEKQDVEEKMSDESSTSFQPSSEPSSEPLIQPVSPIPPESTRVLLPKSDVTVASLKECFGERYFEAGCSPRKFILDVTASVRELLKRQGIQAKVAENTDKALSYLVCVHDGSYSEECDVYRVLLNSRLHEGLLAVRIDTEQQDLYTGTVMDLISKTTDSLQTLVTTLKDNKYFPLFFEDETTKKRQLSKHLGSPEIYVPSVKRVFQKGSDISSITMPTLSDLLEEGSVFCDICYDDISPMVSDSAQFTFLTKCGHRVCDSCWSQHIHMRVHEGFVRMTCPGHDCQEEVKVGVLLSVAPLDLVDKLLQRQEEVRIGGSLTEKWCPNQTCGRVICLQPPSSSSSSTGDLRLQQDVVCVCGTHVCFQCLTPAHWPASCKQAGDYRANLSSATFPDRLAEVHDDFKADELAKLKREMERNTIMVVEGKHCPKCKNFVYKHGGCPQMTCICGQLFCWFCAKPGYSHPDRSCVDDLKEKKRTTTIIVHHVEFGEHPEDPKKNQPALPVNRKQRVSLMERATEYRNQREKKQTQSSAIAILAKSASKAAVKNKVLAQHILTTCSGAFPSSFTDTRQASTPKTSKFAFPLSATVLETVTTFLHNAAHSKQELLEVVEYSMVLLKDLPDSLLRRRALRIAEDLGAFCSFSQSIFEVWGSGETSQASLQEAVRAIMRLAEIQGWIRSTLFTHVATFRKLRSVGFPKQ